MFTKTVTTDTTIFMDRHGDKIGECRLNLIEKDDGNFYGVIETDMPHYTEYTVWHDTAEAQFAYSRDVDEFIEQYKDI